MKEASIKFAAIAALLTELSELFANAPEGSTTTTSADPLEAITLLAARKDQKLVAKVLGKFGAEINDGVITDLGEDDYAKATEKLEALDDAEGAPAEEGGKGGGDTIDIEKLRELAQELIEAGKSTQIRAVLKANGAEKIAKLDEAKYPAVHAALLKLKSKK